MTMSAAADAWHGRVEDDALLRGQGRFGDDVKPEGALIACFARSPQSVQARHKSRLSAAWEQIIGPRERRLRDSPNQKRRLPCSRIVKDNAYPR